MILTERKSGWVIEAMRGSVYSTNAWWHGEVSLPAFTVMIENACFWRTKEGAEAAIQEWDLKDCFACDHLIYDIKT